MILFLNLWFVTTPPSPYKIVLILFVCFFFNFQTPLGDVRNDPDIGTGGCSQWTAPAVWYQSGRITLTGSNYFSQCRYVFLPTYMH